MKNILRKNEIALKQVLTAAANLADKMDYALAIAVPERRKQATGDSTKTANEARRKSAIKKAKADIKAQLAAEGKAADEDDIRIAKAPANEESEEQKQ